MPFDEIPENEVEGYPCDCGGSITKDGNMWYCDTCDFEMDSNYFSLDDYPAIKQGAEF